MAGTLGLEPRVAVLETAGLPINRHPYVFRYDEESITYLVAPIIYIPLLVISIRVIRCYRIGLMAIQAAILELVEGIEPPA